MREEEARSVVGVDGKARDDGFSIPGRQRARQFAEGPRLDLAARGDIELLADRAGEIDMEARQTPALVEEVEGREVDRGEEADAGPARQVGLGQALSLVPEIGGRDGGSGRRLRPLGLGGTGHNHEEGRR